MNNSTNNIPAFPRPWRSGSEPGDQFPNNNSFRYRPISAPHRSPTRTERIEASSNGIGGGGDSGTAAANNLSLAHGNRWPGNSSRVNVPNANAWNRSSRIHSPHAHRPLEISGGDPDVWRLFEDRVRTGPYRLNRFPTHPLSPMRVIVLNGEMANGVNPMLRQFIQQSPPQIRIQWQMQQAQQEDESRLTQTEQEKALKKMKKQIYNPKSRSRRFSFYYRDNVSSNKDEDTDEDGKRCAICLDDFFAREEVLVTPCNHMFHEECIVPWVKANGQCPVCRFALGERRTQSQSNINANLNADDLATFDLMSLIRAMEEAFEWLSAPHERV